MPPTELVLNEQQFVGVTATIAGLLSLLALFKRIAR